MGYIDSNLLAGERIVFRTRLHWNVLLGPLLFVLVAVLPIAWLVYRDEWSNLALIPEGVALLALLAAIARRQSSDFAVTSKRIMMKSGIFNTRSVELLLGKIETISVNQSLGGRMLGYGDIVVTGSGGSSEAFTNIQAPMELRRAVQSVTDDQSNPAKSTLAHPAE